MATVAIALTDINAGPHALVARWGMTDDVNVRRHLIILAAYSFLFSFVFVPYFYGSLQYGLLLDWDWGAVWYFGPITIVPSICYWIWARRALERGVKPWFIHMLYSVIVVPASFFLILAVGTVEFFLWYFFGITR